MLGGVIAGAAGLRAPFAFGAALSAALVPFLWTALAGTELDPAAIGREPG
jgi:hypothetical protein